MQCAASVPMEHEMDAQVTTTYVDPFVVVPSSRTLGCAEICEGGQYRRRGEFGWYDYAKGPGSQPTLEFRPDPYSTLRLSDLERFYSVRTDDVTPEMHAMLEYFTYAEGGLKSHFLICRGVCHTPLVQGAHGALVTVRYRLSNCHGTGWRSLKPPNPTDKTENF